MPIRPEMRARYPRYWRALSWIIRNIRDQGHCLWCGAENYRPHPVTGGKVVLTVAHVSDPRPEVDCYYNLAALCNRCHLRHDRAHHAETRRSRRADGDLFGSVP